MELIMGTTNGRYLAAVIFVMLTTMAFSAYLPWWGFIGFALFAGFWVKQTDRRSFTCGFLGVGLAFLLKMVLVNNANDGILAAKIGQLLGLSGSFGLILVTLLLFGLLGGLAVWSGNLFRSNVGFSRQVEP